MSPEYLLIYEFPIISILHQTCIKKAKKAIYKKYLYNLIRITAGSFKPHFTVMVPE